MKQTFCLGTGKCGTRYIVDLLKANGVEDAEHERDPNMMELAQAFYEGTVSEYEIVQELEDTRADVVFEANRWLSLLVVPLQKAFPDATLFYLVRDGRDYVRSEMRSRDLTPDTAWKTDGMDNLLYPDGRHEMPWFLRCCLGWKETNGHLWDTVPTPGTRCIHAENLWEGREVEDLELLLDMDLPTKTIDPVGTQDSTSFPDYDNWPHPCKQTFYHVCWDMMQLLGYWMDRPDPWRSLHA